MKLTTEFIRRFTVNQYWICLLMFAAVLEVNAQKRVPCNRSLDAANKEYETGNFGGCVKVLSGCLGNYSKQEGVEAYRLLALCQLGLNNEPKAIEASLKLLYLKHDYREYPYFDPVELTRLLNRFEVWPSLELGLKAGFNINSISTGNNYSVNGAAQTFSPKWGYTAGVVGEYYINEKISLNAEVLFEGLSYLMESTPITDWKQQYIEKLNYVNIPLSGRYYFYKRNHFSLAAEAGFQTQFLLGTTSNSYFENQKTGFSYQTSAQLTEYRNKAVFYGLAGIVAKHKVGVGMFVADVRFAMGLRKIVNPDKRYNDINYVLTNQYVDSDIRFNPLYVSIGYQFPVDGMYKVKIRQQ